MIPKKKVWLVWEFQIVTIETAKVQLQSLRVIADTEEKGVIYKAIFEREKQWKFTKDELWFELEEREVNHMFGIEDLNRYVSRNRI
jgi:hypothetical protein